jgi:hypothetical protein
VTCLDGFPLTKQGKGGTALGITIIAAFVGASFGITEMIFPAPFLVKVALEFGPARVSTLMLVGLLAGPTLAKGSPLKGIATKAPQTRGLFSLQLAGSFRLSFGGFNPPTIGFHRLHGSETLQGRLHRPAGCGCIRQSATRFPPAPCGATSPLRQAAANSPAGETPRSAGTGIPWRGSERGHSFHASCLPPPSSKTDFAAVSV